MDDPLFWAKVDTSGECWVWTGMRDPKGYGRLSRKRVSPAPILVHRYSWRLAGNAIPDGLAILHRCDNPPCVRPSHLFVGTLTDNNRDMRAKGRGAPMPDRWNGRCKNGHLMADNREGDACLTCRRAYRKRRWSERVHQGA